ncbi:radical SAM protein [candidate division KSB1 bacterium]|nr:radical SAM protein [candidate division KSB1 bacterium]NIR73003.1 radical SAM protein [candidate division KSB1 bacterium]NIS28277.1 radical SAM protein [candidate division KSB1 bacterium]NIT75149.1 radical SAM protein [candidate division KSB1 bacterium]NIU28956.1 radical SAM protein [candidate division KSB1 bacterium]
MKFEPAYLKTFESGEFEERVHRALTLLESCTVCPRDCKVDRLRDDYAVCRTGRYAVVSSYFPHFGEEDCLRGWKGSGTIFFSNCNLKCVFCQNHDISQQARDRGVQPDRLAEMMLELQNRGCHNINFVTPEHVVPEILEALLIAIGNGLRLPIVYNTSAYDSLDSIHLMDGVVDIYMPDFKFWDPAKAKRYLKAEDYPEIARRVIKVMYRQVGDLLLDESGLAQRGLLLRHLVMPEDLEGTRRIMHWIATELSPTTYVNVMSQYHPAYKTDRYPEINRSLRSAEFRQAVKIAGEQGLRRLDERAAAFF